MTKDEAIVELYGMVQECKVLLIQWQHTSSLNAEQKKQLRRRTKEALKLSSSRIVSEVL